MAENALPFSFFEIPFSPLLWRMGLAAVAGALALTGLALARKNRSAARILWALAGSLVAAEGARTAALWAFDFDSWRGLWSALGVSLLGGALLGGWAAGGSADDAPKKAPALGFADERQAKKAGSSGPSGGRG
jgi:hypothetical protein